MMMPERWNAHLDTDYSIFEQRPNRRLLETGGFASTIREAGAPYAGVAAVVTPEAPPAPTTTAPATTTVGSSVPEFRTVTIEAMAAGATTTAVSDLVGCAPNGGIFFETTSAALVALQVVNCARAASGSFVEFKDAISSSLPVGTPVRFTMPAGSTTSQTAVAVGGTSVTLADMSSCEVNGQITFASSTPETRAVTQCGNPRRLTSEDGGDLSDARRLLSGAVTFSPAVNQLQAAGTPIVFSGTTPPSCFAAEATVRVQGVEDPQPLAELRLGDRVLAGGKFCDVIGFLHTLREKSDMVVIEHAAGELRVSSNHVVLVNGEDKEAGSVMIGDLLSLADGRFSHVVAVRTDKAMGMISPLTASGLIDVDEAVASTYANPAGMQVPHSAMHAAFFATRLVSGLIATSEAKTDMQYLIKVASLPHAS
eukprot:TRINITY_DN12709_c0_g1_i1.p1 TRINITY_DN12709_c0_g1~~TRINITY_DN12709_c0_g1_i1.p1  ORF type:complete len:424 (-),score=55.12 TRINITY_DN12709_c0_g1_i1:402-1673(-)